MRMTAAATCLSAGLLVLLAGRVDAQPGRLAAFWTSPCKLDVVLVAFKRGGAGVGSGDMSVGWGALVHMAGDGDASASAEAEVGPSRDGPSQWLTGGRMACHWPAVGRPRPRPG